MEKSLTPKLPASKQILEDILNPAFLSEEYPRKLNLGDEQTNNAFSCFLNLKQLKEDINKQTQLNCKLQELNEKLVDNIANLRTQGSGMD